jgi:hypothetical protein
MYNLVSSKQSTKKVQDNSNDEILNVYSFLAISFIIELFEDENVTWFSTF